MDSESLGHHNSTPLCSLTCSRLALKQIGAEVFVRHLVVHLQRPYLRTRVVNSASMETQEHQQQSKQTIGLEKANLAFLQLLSGCFLQELSCRLEEVGHLAISTIACHRSEQ